MLILRNLLLPTLLAGTILGACDDPVCPDVVPIGIVVTVVDSISGEAAADGATGFLADGSYREEMSVHTIDSEGQALSLGGADGRPDIYSVAIERDGYETWLLGGVEVADAQCGVETVELTARLQPQ